MLEWFDLLYVGTTGGRRLRLDVPPVVSWLEGNSPPRDCSPRLETRQCALNGKSSNVVRLVLRSSIDINALFYGFTIERWHNEDRGLRRVDVFGE